MNSMEDEILSALRELETSIDGSATIKDGRVIITPPKGNGQFPVIRPGLHTRVLVNGQEITRDTVLTPSDEIEIQAIDEEREELLVEVEVSPDEMKAYVTIKPPLRKTYHIKDVPPSLELEVAVEEEYVYTEPPGMQEALEALRNAGVVEGIIKGQLTSALQKCDGEKVLVAMGVPAINGEDGYLDLVYKKRAQRRIVPPSDRIDYREHGAFESVDCGEIVAVILPPRSGEDGLTVTGKVLKARKGKPVRVVCGQGVKQVGECIVATQAGRPSVSGNRVEVLPLLVIEEDVDLHTGNVHFQGDVVVTGDVRNSMLIEAGGMVKVCGVVEQAEIVARDGIVLLKSAIGSKVRAGIAVGHLANVLPIARELLTELEKLRDAFTQLREYMKIREMAHVPATTVFQVLTERKFNQVPKMAKKLVDTCSAREVPLNSEEISMFRSLVDLIRLNIRPEDTEFPQRFAEKVALLKGWLELVDRNLSRTSDIEIGYVQNSELYATGNIRVVGQGCFNSILVAGNEITVSGSPGVFRGGKIIAGGDVYVEEIGVPGIAYSHVIIPANRRVVFGRIAGGCLVKIGSEYVRFEKPHGHTVVFRDEEGVVRVR